MYHERWGCMDQGGNVGGGQNMGGGCKGWWRRQHIQGGGDLSLYLGRMGHRRGEGVGGVWDMDCGGGWLAALSTSWGEWSVQGG